MTGEPIPCDIEVREPQYGERQDQGDGAVDVHLQFSIGEPLVLRFGCVFLNDPGETLRQAAYRKMAEDLYALAEVARTKSNAP